mgnify:CR=1 FL=1
MNHQDWKPVMLRNPNIAKAKQPTEIIKRIQHHGTKDVDMEESRVKMVGSQLKRTFEQARLNSRDPQTGRCYTRDRLAKLIHGDPKTITLLETGKLSEKEAKQIALKVERVLKIKILEASSSHP